MANVLYLKNNSFHSAHVVMIIYNSIRYFCNCEVCSLGTHPGVLAKNYLGELSNKQQWNLVEVQNPLRHQNFSGNCNLHSAKS